MPKLRNFLIKEHYLNLFNNEEKEKYKNEVWNMLQNAYKTIGGLKGSGFENIENMIDTIPMWKLERKNNEIISCILYKDKNGRKIVALAANGTPEGKKSLYKMFEDDIKFERSYVEISLGTLRMAYKIFGDSLENFSISVDKVEEILNLPVSKVDNFIYVRDIGGHKVEKMMVGKPNIPLYKK